MALAIRFIDHCKNKSETFKSWFQRLSMHVKHTKPFDDAIAVHEKFSFRVNFQTKII